MMGLHERLVALGFIRPNKTDLECVQIQGLLCLVLKNYFIQQQQRDVQS